MNLMNSETARQLIELNHVFYQSCAESFSKTRQRVQPGVLRIIKQTIPKDKPLSILDLGCGNGELAHVLQETGGIIQYQGVDFSLPLMKTGEGDWANDSFNASFHEADLLQEGWDRALNKHFYDRIFCFAVLHHFPGLDNRVRFINQVANLLAPDGIFVFSVWQFLNSPRLTKRIQPWEAAHLTDSLVDENDYLLDWRADCVDHPLRYVHHFSLPELDELRLRTGFRFVERFTSDGHTHDLGEYQVWAK
jgi:SAM-dependent methyltransferase